MNSVQRYSPTVTYESGCPESMVQIRESESFEGPLSPLRTTTSPADAMVLQILDHKEAPPTLPHQVVEVTQEVAAVIMAELSKPVQREEGKVEGARIADLATKALEKSRAKNEGIALNKIALGVDAIILQLNNSIKSIKTSSWQTTKSTVCYLVSGCLFSCNALLARLPSPAPEGVWSYVWYGTGAAACNLSGVVFSRKAASISKSQETERTKNFIQVKFLVEKAVEDIFSGFIKDTPLDGLYSNDDARLFCKYILKVETNKPKKQKKAVEMTPQRQEIVQTAFRNACKTFVNQETSKTAAGLMLSTQTNKFFNEIQKFNFGKFEIEELTKIFQDMKNVINKTGIKIQSPTHDKYITMRMQANLITQTKIRNAKIIEEGGHFDFSDQMVRVHKSRLELKRESAS
ncbi:MAG: hypothetical protein H0W88_08565 [Parachlamydiaceae bacterium]|nr:hypothetical protein [Parachlamydiaceae bacterium]